MTGRVTKEKAKPRKTSETKTDISPADANLLLTWLCMKNNGGKSIDFETVAATMNCTLIAAKSRYRRVKERMDVVMESMGIPKDTKPEPAFPSKSAKQDKQDKQEQEKAKESYSDELAKDI